MNSITNNIFYTGRRNNISGVPVQLYPSGNVVARVGVTIVSDATNTGNIYIGNSSGLTMNSNNFTDGFPLPSGASITLGIDKPSLVWLVADNGTNTVQWIAH